VVICRAVGFVKAVYYFRLSRFIVAATLLGFNHYFNIAACQAGGNFVAKTVFWDWCAWPTILIILGWWVKSVRKRLWVPVFRRIWFCRSR